MVHVICELLWVRSILHDLGVAVSGSTPIDCDNKVATFIANNSAFHEQTKHIDFDCYFIRDAILVGKISTPYDAAEDQIVDIFTKALFKKHFELCSKLSMFDVHARA
jgi:hypothetical protein